MIGRMKRLEEINPPVNECVRAVCDLLSDVLTAGWNKIMLRAIVYSVRSLGTDVLVEIVRKAIKILTCCDMCLGALYFPIPHNGQVQRIGFARPSSGVLPSPDA